MLEAAYRNSSVEWKPSAVVALATSVDDSQVAAAREDGSLEIWLVSPGSVGWHCQLTIHGDPNTRVSSLVWCRTGLKGLPCGRLFSSSIDGSVSEWDLFHLKQKNVLESIGVSIWQMAVAPSTNTLMHAEQKPQDRENGYADDIHHDSDDSESSESEEDSDSDGHRQQSIVDNPCVAVACDDGCVRMYFIPDSDKLIYRKSLPRVSGRALSIAWSCDGKLIYSGSSDGFIRCWDAELGHEKYRITVGLGGLGSGTELCLWSLLSLRSGVLVSGDSTGNVQFWDSQHGTLLQAHPSHKGDVNALAAAPSHNRVFSAGSDGQVVLYKFSSESVGSDDNTSSYKMLKKWVFVGHVRSHTHDIRALTVAVPISREDPLPDEKLKRVRTKKPVNFSYHKWAHLGVPMLISAGDDMKLFAYSAQEFTKFSPHDICPAPQRVPMKLVLNTIFNQNSLLLVQAPYYLDILRVRLKGESMLDMGPFPSRGCATTDLIVRIKTKSSRKVICSTISNTGMLLAYSDHVRPYLFELKKHDAGKSTWTVYKRQLPQKLPFAHSMVFSSDSSQLMIAGHDRRIYVVDVSSLELLHTFTPRQETYDEELPPSEPPITKMYTSCDGQWLAAINCFGDAYIFNLDTQRQHWFIARLDGASVTAGGFPPQNNNVLIITTSSNQVYAFDIEAKQLGEWSMRCTFALPTRFQEFPGEVIGLSFLPSSSPTAIVYSARAMCYIDFGLPVDRVEKNDLANGQHSPLKKLQSTITGRLKRKLKSYQTEGKHGNNFEFIGFRDPVLFIGHLSENSILIMDKPWIDVVKNLDTPPVHRHIFGT